MHGKNGEKLDMSPVTPEERTTLEPRLAALLPDMPAQMRADSCRCCTAISIPLRASVSRPRVTNGFWTLNIASG